MANTVQIQVTVDNAQAIAALGSTTAALKTLGSTASMTNSQWTGMQGGMIQTTQGMYRLGEAAKQTSGHLTTSLDGVRLLSQEFGLRLPRALESILSRMPAVTSAIQGALTGLAGFAIVEVLFRAGDAVYNLYNKYISLTAAADAYNKEVQKHRDEEFINAHSIETATQRIDEATASAKAFNSAGEEIRKGAWADLFSGDAMRMSQGFGALISSRQTVDQGYKSRAQSDALNPKVLAQQHEIALMQIEAAHAADGELRGQQKINAELQKRLELNRENQNYTRAQDSINQGGALRSSGQQKRDLEDAQARAEAGTQRIELERQITQKTASLQAEATNAALVGNQLLTAQKLQAEEEIRRSGVGTAQQIAAIELKYHNEQMKRLREEQDAVDKRAHSEAEAGLSTYAKIQAQGQDRLDDIEDRKKKGLYADQQKPGDPSALADKDRATAQAQMYREMTDAEKKFEEEQKAARDRDTNEQLGAFAKIDSELQRRLQVNANRYSGFYGTVEANAAAVRKLTEDNGAAEANAARERQQVEQTIHDQTLAKDREAMQAAAKGRADGLGAWAGKYRATIAEIQAEHTAMIAKINTEEQKPGVTKSAFDDYQRQKVDADAMANAQIEDANQQLAHSIAGTLESAFDSPIKTIQKKFEKMFFDIAAQWLAHSGVFGQQGSQASGQAGLQSGASGSPAALASHGLGGLLHSFPGMPAFGGIAGGTAAGSGASGAGYENSPIGQMMHRLGIGHATSAAAPPSSQSGIAPPPIASVSTLTGVGIPATSSTRSQGSPSSGRYSFSGDESTWQRSNFVSGAPVFSAIAAPPSTATSGNSAAMTGATGIAYTPAAVASMRSAVAPEYEGSGATAISTPSSSAGSNAPGAIPIGGSNVAPNSIASAREQMTSSVSSFSSLASTAASANTVLGGSATASAGLSAAGTALGAGMTAYQGFQGVLGGFEAGNAGGVLSATMGGAELGGAVGSLAGPIGSAIGAGIGAAAGAAIGLVGDITGEGNRLGAASYYKQTMLPQFEKAAADYFSGSTGSSETALGQVASIAAAGDRAIVSKYGGTAASWVRSQYTDKEEVVVTREIDQLAAGGHDYIKTSAVQYHTGGWVDGFGDLSTSANEGYIHAMLGEAVVNPVAASTHGAAIDAMNSGASESDIAGMYLRNSTAASSASVSGGDTHHHWNVQTMDAHSFAQFLNDRGGMDAIVSANTNRNAMYNGEAD